MIGFICALAIEVEGIVKMMDSKEETTVAKITYTKDSDGKFISAPSPITAITLPPVPESSRAVRSPKAEEIEVEECPFIKKS